MLCVISLDTLCTFANATPKTRNMVEGQNVINSGQIIMCGATKLSETEIDLYALCLQTSGISVLPHVITGTLKVNKCDVQISNMNCSCKAGSSHSCKHIVAVLLYCHRNDIRELEPVSSTDMKCLWSHRKGRALEEYLPSPTSTFCCVKQERKPLLPFSVLMEIRQELIQSNSSSAIATHRNRIQNLSESSKSCDSISVASGVMIVTDYIHNYINLILANAAESLIMNEIKSFNISIQVCCENTYLNKVATRNVATIANETRRSHMEWLKQRQFRVTGSRCYSLYTYGKDDWKTKTSKYFWPKQFSNKYTRHGIRYEATARYLYSQITNNLVQECGLMVSIQNPWLAYSPDGIVISNNTPQKLLEIKCPFELKDTSNEALLEKCAYLKLVNDQIVLRQKHSHYGQIQFGMGLLNLKTCDFVIYSSIAHTVRILSINYDEQFAKELFTKLKCIYFEKMIHTLC